MATLRQRIVKFLTKDTYGQSRPIGEVIRNYGKASSFNPVQQVTGITYKAVNKIGQSLSVYEPHLKRKNGDMVENHPLYTLFNNPNPRRTASDFIHMYGMLTEIYGETFWYKVKGEMTGRVKELYLLDPSKVELKVIDGELLGYVLHKSNGDMVPFELDEIHHDKTPNPFNEWRGMSVIEKAAVYIDTEINTAHFTLNYIKNNASPSGIVSLPNMTREAFNKFVLQWREGYEGPHNAGKTGFLRGEGVDFKAVGATLQDVDQEITRKMAEDDVLMMLEVPKPLLGRSGEKGLGRADIDALYYIYNKEKIEPVMKRLDRIYQMLLPDVSPRDAETLTVAHESPVPEDKDFEHKRIKDLVNVAITVNEAREMMGLAPIPDGDELNPQNTVPVTRSTKKVVIKKRSKSDEVKKINEEQEAFRSEIMKTSDLYATKLKTAISSFAAEQEQNIIDRINVQTKTYEEWLFEVKQQSEELAAILVPIVIELMETQAEDVANFITGELLTISPEMRKTVEAEILKVSGLFNEDTLRALENTLSEGQAAGESLAKLKKRVESVYGDAKGFRAERIARTESARSSNRTAEMVYSENGFNRVEWFINPGACEFCRTYAGRTREIGGSYTNIGDVVTGEEGGKLRIDYSDIDVPPLHPNCACSIIPVS